MYRGRCHITLETNSNLSFSYLKLHIRNLIIYKIQNVLNEKRNDLYVCRSDDRDHRAVGGLAATRTKETEASRLSAGIVAPGYDELRAMRPRT